MIFPFRKGIQEAFPTADLTFDKFHVMKLMNEALDNVRRQEQKEESALKRSRYLWLSNECNLRKDQVEKLATLSSLNLKTARAYRIKLALQDVYARSADRNDAERLLEDWHQWASRSRIDAIRSFASTVRSNWTGILNYFNSRLTNAILESINSIIQSARNRAKAVMCEPLSRSSTCLPVN